MYITLLNLCLMTDQELVKITQQAIAYLRKSNPCVAVADIEDVVSAATVKYIEKYSSLDSLTSAWLIRAGGRKLIDEYRKRHHTVSLGDFCDRDAVEYPNFKLVDLGCDNPDLCSITQELLFPWLTECTNDEAA